MHLRAAFVSALVAFPVFAQTTTTFQDVTGGYSGTRDARITCCDTATVNEGAAASYALIPDSSTATLIRFAIFQSEGGPVPDGSQINSASLALFQFFGPAAVFKVNRVLRSWNESAVNWNTTDGATAWQTIGAFGSADISPTADAQATSIDASSNCGTPQPACWVTFNVTAAVSDMSSGGPKNGWKLAYVSDPDGTQTNSHTPKELYSREATKDPTLRPTLTVTWTAGPPPPSTGSNTNTLQDVTGGYSGTRDARITCCATATTNEGAAVSYALIPDSSTATLIRFAIFQSEGGPVPDRATINSASLSLFQFFGPAAVFKVNRVLRSWNESAVNWNTTDGATAWQTIGAFGSADISPTADAQATSIDASANCGAPQPACWVTFNVTAAVSDMSSGGPKNGWKLAYVSDPDGTLTNSHTPKELYSREATKDPTLRPTLTVTWSGGSTTTNPPTGTGSVNAVATFHSMGLYYNPPVGTPAGETVFLRYRRSSDSVWKHGHPLWNDGGTPWSARGSAVQLDAGTSYVFQFGVGANYDTATWLDTVTQSTWNETNTLPTGRIGPGWSGENTTLVTSQYIGRLAPNSRRSVLYIGPDMSGTASAYTVYDFGNAATAHVIVPNDANTFGVVISANYVILKNLKVIGGASGVYIDPGVHDVIIDGLDISGFSVDSHVALTANGQSGDRGTDEDAGIKFPDDTNGKTSRVVIQNCSIHNPAFGASSWDAGHPAGPTAIMMYPTGGQIVVRYNAVWSTTTAGDADLNHFFEDGLVQGGDNAVGLGPDIDIYKNRVQHYFDDGLETDGQGVNNRVWDNYFDYGGASAVSTTGVLVGPAYVWRNVYNRQRMYLGSATSSRVSWGPTATNNERSYMLKSGGNGGNGGRRYLYHNTSLQAPASSMGTSGAPLGAGFGVGGTGRDPDGSLNGLENTKSRNNVFEMFISDGHGVFDLTDATPNDCGAAPDNCLDFDLTNGAMSETHGVPLTAPAYQAGNGWSAGSSGRYRLQPGTAGYDQGEVIWGFNDNFTGAKPDMGAQEDGTPDMQFGPGATGN